MTTDDGIIIVTGSNGRIGDAVMRRFAGRFDEVVGFDRKSPNPPPPGCVYVPVDITSDDSVREGLTAIREHHGSRVASFVHLAAHYDFLGEPSPQYEEITVRGTGRLLRGLRDLEFQVEQFIFSSTMLVHRSSDLGQRIDEHSPIEPSWAYPESKVKTEQSIREERGDIPAVLLRISGVYDDGCHSIPLAQQIQRVYERQLSSRVYAGTTAHGASYLHMDDLVDAIGAAVERRAALPPELPLVLGEPETLSYDELQHTLARLLHGENLETIPIPIQLKPLIKIGAWLLAKTPGRERWIRPWMIDRAGDHYALDITRARTLLGWEPTRSLRDALPMIVAALKADPLGWYRENELEPPRSLRNHAKHRGHEAATIGADTPGRPGPTMGHGQHPPQAEAAPEHGGPMRHGGDAHAMDDMAGMGMEESAAMAAHGQAAPWAHFFAAIILGLWLITSPAALGYRSLALTWSDAISGTLVIGFAVVTLVRGPAWAPWANSLVGIWLLFAPLVFEAPTAAGYANDTLAGTLVIAFVLFMPGMPGMRMLPGPDAPPGWSYNPSSLTQRAPIIALALVGFVLSRQMAAYQLGYTGSVWEPFFDPGTRAVLDSDVSRSFPISDAGLGAVAYMVEALMGFMGDKARWRTMPWMVAFFGILVVPLGVASISLIILQPVAVGAWCTPCLIAALAMLIMIALTLDEVVAMGQFLAQTRRDGESIWRMFWMGGTLAETGADAGAVRPDVVSAGAMAWGVALPWNLLASVAVGLWLMASPAVFGTVGSAADSDNIVGALAVTVAMIALADVGRAVRFLNIAFGAWIVAAPWLLGGDTAASRWNDVAAGAALILLSLRRGPVRERYGRWQRAIR